MAYINLYVLVSHLYVSQIYKFLIFYFLLIILFLSTESKLSFNVFYSLLTTGCLVFMVRKYSKKVWPMFLYIFILGKPASLLPYCNTLD